MVNPYPEPLSPMEPPKTIVFAVTLIVRVPPASVTGPAPRLKSEVFAFHHVLLTVKSPATTIGLLAVTLFMADVAPLVPLKMLPMSVTVPEPKIEPLLKR